MKTKRFAACLGSALLFVLIPGAIAAEAAEKAKAVEVIRCPNASEKLAERWEWARQTVRRRSLANGYWIGYSVEKLMEENSFLYCFGGSRNRAEDASLAAVLEDQDTLYPSKVRNISFFSGRYHFGGRAGHDRIVKLVKKRIGILYRFAKGPDSLPESIGATDDHFPVAFEGKPLVWLGPASDEESLRVLTSIYDRSVPEKLAERIVETAGIHEISAPVIPFLERIIKSRAPESVRVEAVSALGGYPDARVLGILVPLAKADSSLEVRKEAVEALGEIGEPEAVDALAAIARSTSPAEVREEAIEALVENVSAKVLSTLEGIIDKDPDREIQEEAVEALAEIEDGSGVPLLIKIAKNHPDVEIRKTAVEALGESDDPRALKALIELATNKSGR
jgi:hypothetical protein